MYLSRSSMQVLVKKQQNFLQNEPVYVLGLPVLHIIKTRQVHNPGNNMH